MKTVFQFRQDVMDDLSWGTPREPARSAFIPAPAAASNQGEPDEQLSSAAAVTRAQAGIAGKEWLLADSEPRLPHEHDESSDSQASGPREVMERARRDVEEGQQDTDLRGTPGLEKPEKRDSR